MRKILAHNLAHDECTNVTREPKREHKQLIYNILHKSLNRNFGKYIQFCIEEVVYMCAMRLKARGIYGTYSGTRVPNSEKYVPNENCILLKHKIFPNSVFLYWKIQVILHREVRAANANTTQLHGNNLKQLEIAKVINAIQIVSVQFCIVQIYLKYS